MAKNYYEILGVTKSASKDDIKKAFYKLAHKYHPDKKGGDEARFKEVNEAYQVLSDEKKRQEYDTYGQTFSGAGNQGGPGFGGFDFNQGGMEFDFGDLGDMFGDIFGGASPFGGGSRRQQRGADISLELHISFEDSVFGTKRSVRITKTGTCDTCHGNGAKPGSKKVTCKTCNGQGKVREARRSIFGTIASVATCKTCHGSGEVPETPCPTCKGAGVLRKQEDIEIKIPAGIKNGEMIRMTGLGEAVAHGTPGDLYVKITVGAHKLFKRDGNNIIYAHTIKVTDALLGAKHTIATLDGVETIDIPEGVNHGHVVRIAGKGVPNERGKRGDFLVVLDIKMPQKLPKQAKAVVEKLREEGL